jgi:hypothetical protein
MLPKDINQHSYPLKDYSHKHIPGTSVYYLKTLHTSILPHTPIPHASTTILQLHLNNKLNQPMHTIINVYRPPRKTHLATFITSLRSLLELLQSKHPHADISIVGDININLLTLPPTHDFYNLLIENNLYSTITTPTRYDTVHNTTTLIDVILTTMRTDTTAGTIAPQLSDHLPIYTIFHTNPPRQESTQQKSLSNQKYEKNKHTKPSGKPSKINHKNNNQ